ncbi:FtsX-like permease family protein [Renibacterium salmoninarum]|nr:ABC transporter permease [Renibacterium salmoninarum]
MPSFGLSAAATFGQSLLPNTEETIATQLGHTQAKFINASAPGSDFGQSPISDWAFYNPGPNLNGNLVDLKTIIPQNYRLLSWRQNFINVAGFDTTNRVDVIESDVLDPAFYGKYSLLGGRAAAAADEVLASPGLLAALNATEGQRISTDLGDFTVVGTVRDSKTGDSSLTLYLRPGQLSAGQLSPDQAQAGFVGPPSYFAVGDQPISWEQIKQFNKSGVAVPSRSVIQNPPAGVPDNNGPYSSQESSYWTGALVGVLALLEVGLLAGAAFAVGAKKQQRELALLAASGAESATLRAIIIANAVWLGLIAGVVGAASGLASALLLVGYFRSVGRGGFYGQHPNFWIAGAVVLVALIASLAAASIPARAVAKQATLAALRGGRSVVAHRRWPTVVGLIAIGLGLAATVTGAVVGYFERHNDPRFVPLYPYFIIGGEVVGVLGTVLILGRIVDFMGRRIGRLPLIWRLAARDSARNRSRTVPAVAAVLAASALAGAVVVGGGSGLESTTQNYSWSVNIGQANFSLSTTVSKNTADGTETSIVKFSPEQYLTKLKDASQIPTEHWVLRGEANDECHLTSSKTGDTQESQTPCPEHFLIVPPENRCPVDQLWATTGPQ